MTENLLKAIYGFELVVLTFFIAYTIFPYFKKCIHDGIDTLIKWSGFTALCISMSILLFNLLFNHKVNNQIQIDHVYKWQLSIALMLNFLSFHRNTRPLWTSILISTFLYKAYLFPIKVGDLVLFTCFSISLFNSLFYFLNRYKRDLGIQTILSLFVIVISIVGLYNHAYVLSLVKSNNFDSILYKAYVLYGITATCIGLVTFIIPGLMSMCLFILPMVLSLLFMYTGAELLLVTFTILLFLSAISWTVGFNQKQVI